MIVLLFIGLIVFVVLSSKSSKTPTFTSSQSPRSADEEFEEMFLSGASGHDIDDF